MSYTDIQKKKEKLKTQGNDRMQYFKYSQNKQKSIMGSMDLFNGCILNCVLPKEELNENISRN